MTTETGRHVPRLESVGGRDGVDVNQPWIVTIRGMIATLEARGVQHAGRMAYLIAAENGRMHPLPEPPSGDDEWLMTRDQLTAACGRIGVAIQTRPDGEVLAGRVAYPATLALDILGQIDAMTDGGGEPERGSAEERIAPAGNRADPAVIRTALGRCRDAIHYLSRQEQGRVLSSLNVDINGVPVDDDVAPGAVTPQGVIDGARDGMEHLPPAGRREVVLTLADDAMRHRDREDAGRYLIPSGDAMAAAEVSAMAGVAEALARLSEAEAGRVIAWARARFLYGTEVTR